MTTTRIGGGNIESLFEKHSLETIRDIETQIEEQVSQKKIELRQLVGTFYRDLIESADSIAEMEESGTTIVDVTNKMSHKCHQILTDLQSSSVISVPSENDTSEKQEVYELAVQAKEIIETPEYIWNCLDCMKYTQAAQRYLRAQGQYQKLMAARSVHAGRHLLPKFTLLQTQWAAIQLFRPQIVQSAYERLVRADAPHAAVLAALSAVLALDEAPPAQVFRRVSRGRILWVLRRVASAPHASSVKAVTSLLAAAGQGILRTIVELCDVAMNSKRIDRGVRELLSAGGVDILSSDLSSRSVSPDTASAACRHFLSSVQRHSSFKPCFASVPSSNELLSCGEHVIEAITQAQSGVGERWNAVPEVLSSPVDVWATFFAVPFANQASALFSDILPRIGVLEKVSAALDSIHETSVPYDVSSVLWASGTMPSACGDQRVCDICLTFESDLSTFSANARCLQNVCTPEADKRDKAKEKEILVAAAACCNRWCNRWLDAISDKLDVIRDEISQSISSSLRGCSMALAPADSLSQLPTTPTSPSPAAASTADQEGVIDPAETFQSAVERCLFLARFCHWLGKEGGGGGGEQLCAILSWGGADKAKSFQDRCAAVAARAYDAWIDWVSALAHVRLSRVIKDLVPSADSSSQIAEDTLGYVRSLAWKSISVDDGDDEGLADSTHSIKIPQAPSALTYGFAFSLASVISSAGAMFFPPSALRSLGQKLRQTVSSVFEQVASARPTDTERKSWPMQVMYDVLFLREVFGGRSLKAENPVSSLIDAVEWTIVEEHMRQSVKLQFSRSILLLASVSQWCSVPGASSSDATRPADGAPQACSPVSGGGGLTTTPWSAAPLVPTAPVVHRIALLPVSAPDLQRLVSGRSNGSRLEDPDSLKSAIPRSVGDKVVATAETGTLEGVRSTSMSYVEQVSSSSRFLASLWK
eukprot:Rmarinus@m.29761